MVDYYLSPDGSAVYRLLPIASVASTTLDTNLLTSFGYTISTGTSGTLTNTAYEAAWQQGGGGHFEAVYSYGATLPAGTTLQWIQVVSTSAPLGGGTSPYLDNRLNATTLTQPFYSLTVENSTAGPAQPAGSLFFYDFSQRPSSLMETTSSVDWSAALYPVLVNGTTITVENGLQWGWTEKKATVGTDSGTFVSPSPGSATVTGVGTSHFTWGSGQPDVSSLDFSGGSFDTKVGEKFKLGTLTYHNGTIASNTGAGSVEFDINVNLTNIPEKNMVLKTMFTLVNTANTDDPIASADTVQIGNYGYTFNVLEGATASVDIYGTLSTGAVTAPAGVGIDALYSSGPFVTGGDFTLNIAGLSNPSTGGFIVLLGDEKDNVLEGSSGADTIKGLGGNDTITGLGGNDTIDGGTGTDVAIYSAAAKYYQISLAQTGTFTVQDRSGVDGTDTVTNVETFKFSDQSLDTSWYTKMAGLSSSQIVDLVELYIASFNRAPDSYGLCFWGAQMYDGMSLEQLAKYFFTGAETAAAYPEGQSVSTFIDVVYHNVLGRSPDAAGNAFWEQALTSGAVARDSFLLAIINGARAATGGAADAQYLANKELAGAHYAITNGLSDATWAKQVMSVVDGTAASVTTANALSDGFLSTAETVAGSELVVQLVGVAT